MWGGCRPPLSTLFAGISGLMCSMINADFCGGRYLCCCLCLLLHDDVCRWLINVKYCIFFLLNFV